MLIKDKQFVKKKTTRLRSLRVVYTKIMISICSHWHFPSPSSAQATLASPFICTNAARQQGTEQQQQKKVQTELNLHSGASHVLRERPIPGKAFRVHSSVQPQSRHSKKIDRFRAENRGLIVKTLNRWFGLRFSRCENIDLFLRRPATA